MGSSRHNNQLCDNPTPSNILLYVTPVHGCLYSMDYYLQKTYYKTAALISNSCKAIAVLAGQTTEVQALAYQYGRHLVCCIFLTQKLFLFLLATNCCDDLQSLCQGIAYQLIDDILDFTGTSASLGKASLSDIHQVILLFTHYFFSNIYFFRYQLISKELHMPYMDREL
jgi:geranylgeranyl pyrophosphate synthase